MVRFAGSNPVYCSLFLYICVYGPVAERLGWVLQINHYDHITVGKKYDVIKTNYIYVNSEEFVDSYRIVNDDDKELSYRVGLFKTLDKIRDEKLEESLKWNTY